MHCVTSVTFDRGTVHSRMSVGPWFGSLGYMSIVQAITLPVHLRQCESLGQFKRLLKTYLFVVCDCGALWHLIRSAVQKSSYLLTYVNASLLCQHSAMCFLPESAVSFKSCLMMLNQFFLILLSFYFSVVFASQCMIYFGSIIMSVLYLFINVKIIQKYTIRDC